MKYYDGFNFSRQLLKFGNNNVAEEFLGKAHYTGTHTHSQSSIHCLIPVLIIKNVCCLGSLASDI